MTAQRTAQRAKHREKAQEFKQGESLVKRVYVVEDEDFEQHWKGQRVHDPGLIAMKEHLMETMDTKKVVYADLWDMAVLEKAQMALQHQIRQENKHPGDANAQLVLDTRKHGDGLKARLRKLVKA